MITSHHNPVLKDIRRLLARNAGDGRFVAEGEDLLAAAGHAGWPALYELRSGVDVEPELLDAVSGLGSGTRVVGVYEQRWQAPGGDLSVWLHGVEDPGNVGTIIRSAHALADGPVILGPGCADPYSPKAVRATMGSLFARPPARAALAEVPGAHLALGAHGKRTLAEVELTAPLVLCLGAERAGLPPELDLDAVRIPVRAESLNVAMAATVALYEAATRTPPRGPSPRAGA